jgi:hypothetical protein
LRIADGGLIMPELNVLVPASLVIALAAAVLLVARP